ncbi:immunity protein YezG family protein [Bacillus sp. HSf4]|nr:immunity protein YezG family protein [Bacillus sp. HSf4]WFA07186.1 DUF600 family protein [Bacillus sp. HSf4]
MIQSDGKFKFDYEDLSVANDHIRKIIWKYKNLGLQPE